MISEGGGVFDRKAKSIRLSAQVKTLFAFLHDDCMSRPMRLHTTAHHERWTAADASALHKCVVVNAEGFAELRAERATQPAQSAPVVLLRG